jgi:hypothetical protein
VSKSRQEVLRECISLEAIADHLAKKSPAERGTGPNLCHPKYRLEWFLGGSKVDNALTEIEVRMVEDYIRSKVAQLGTGQLLPCAPWEPVEE